MIFFKPDRIMAGVSSIEAEEVMRKLDNRFKGNLEGKAIATWGLSFKPNTDGMREAPSLVLIDSILKAAGIVQVFDSFAINEAKHYWR